MKPNKLIFGILTTILIFIKFQPSFSQENYMPGYIIDLNGNRLNGFIDYRDWEKSPERIFFKEDKKGEKIIKIPAEIREFGVSDEIYVSATVEAEIYTLNLEYDPEFKTEVTTTFMQTIIQGSKCLYYYRNKYGKEQFYIKNQNGFELLIYKKYLIRKNETISSVENKKYLGQLRSYLTDCQSILPNLENTKYTKASLERLFLNYYSCTLSGFEFHKMTEKITVEAGLFAGLTQTSLKFGPFALDYFEKSHYTRSTNFTAGLSADFIFPGNGKKWSIYNEIIYTSFNIKGYLNEYVDPVNYEITNTTMSYSYLKMNNMFRFKYPVGKMFVYANIGMSNGYAITEINYRKVEKLYYSTHSVNEYEALAMVRKWEQGYVIGLGTKYNRSSFEIRYEKGNGMSGYDGLTSRTDRVSFLIGFRF